MARIHCKRCQTSRELKVGPFDHYDSWMREHMGTCWNKPGVHPKGHFELEATYDERNREADFVSEMNGPHTGNPKGSE